jgi:outer membrane protein assembly factor BamB
MMLSIRRMIASIKTISPVYLVLLIPIIGLLIYADVRMSDIDIWRVSNTSTIDAQILWQKSIACLTPGYTTSHGAIAVANSQVVFNSGCLGIVGNHFVALNLQTGEIVWKKLGAQSYQILAVDDGYLAVYGDSFIGKLDFAGNSIWESEQFPSRAMRAFYVRGDTIYAPFSILPEDGVYLLSPQTGQIINTIVDKNAAVTLNTVHINWFGDNQIAIVDNRTGKTIWTTNRPTMPYYAPFTYFEQIDDVLLIYSGGNQIDAFDIYTSHKLWHLKHKYGSDPLVVNGLLVVYGTDDVISILNPKNGQVTGTVNLERKPGSKRNVPTLSVALAEYDNILAIAYTNTDELIALKIDFPKLAQSSPSMPN